jgi:hypothetical protein
MSQYHQRIEKLTSITRTPVHCNNSHAIPRQTCWSFEQSCAAGIKNISLIRFDNRYETFFPTILNSEHIR